MQEHEPLGEHLTPAHSREPSVQPCELLSPFEMARFLSDVSEVFVEDSNAALEGILQLALREICHMTEEDPMAARAYISALLETGLPDLQVRAVLPILWLVAKSPQLGQEAWLEVRTRFPGAIVESCVLVEAILEDAANDRSCSLPVGPGGVAAAKFYWDEMRPLT